jgi:type I restriction enzyme S subunit
MNKMKTYTLGELALDGNSGMADGPFGSNLRAAEYQPSGIPIIRGSNLSIGTDELKEHEYVFITREKADKLVRSRVVAGDIVFTKKGTLGQTGYINSNSKYTEYNLSSNQLKMTPDSDKVNGKYLYILLSSKRTVQRIISESEATGVPKINLAYLRSFSVKLPDLETQNKAEHILSSLDDKIHLLRQQNATLESMAQALFKSWFVDFDPVIDNALGAGRVLPEALGVRVALRGAVLAGGAYSGLPEEVKGLFPGSFVFSEELGKWVPEGWEVKAASDIATINIGKTPPRKEQHWFSPVKNVGDVVWVSIRDLGKEDVYVDDSSEYLTAESIERYNVRKAPAGSVLLSFKMTLGRVAITTTELTTNEAIAHFSTLGFGVTKEFLYLSLKNYNYDQLGSTSSIATAINSKIVKSMPLLVPSERASNAFQQKSSCFFTALKNNESEIQTLTRLRDVLLPELISGRLGV